MQGYCFKCKAKKEITGEEVLFKNGRRALKGACPDCGTKIFKIKKGGNNASHN